MLGAIVLAAGESRRMGSQKLLLPFGGKTVIRHVVEVLFAGGLQEVIAVSGADAERIREELAGTPVHVVENRRYREGMLSSVRTGLAAAGASWDGFLIALGDQPSIRRELISDLTAFFDAAGTAIVAPAFEGKRGHPLIISTAYREAVMTRYDDTGLRGLLREYPDAVREFEVGTATVLEDMDYPADYERELRALEAREKHKG